MRDIQESYLTRDSDSKENYEPQLTKAFRTSLVDLVRGIHEEILEPPEETRNHAEKLEAWKPNVKCSIDWEVVLSARGDAHHAAEDATASPEDNGDPSESEAPAIGLIGLCCLSLYHDPIPNCRYRSAKCRQIIFSQPSLWHHQGSRHPNTWQINFFKSS